MTIGVCATIAGIYTVEGFLYELLLFGLIAVGWSPVYAPIERGILTITILLAGLLMVGRDPFINFIMYEIAGGN